MERLTFSLTEWLCVVGIFWFCIFIGITQAEEIKTEFELTTTTVIVNWYDTELELQEALDDAEIAGLSECEHRPEFNTSFCELWLVTPTDSEDYYAFDTIGHEFYHALKGDFHQ